jgi:flagellar biosynthesis/type III secretory pathway M-ring protein FliF/YscJ
LIVETLPFEATLHSDPPAAAAPAERPATPADRVPAWLRTPKGMGAAAGGAVLLLVLAVVGFRRLLRRPAGIAETRMALAAGAGSAPALASGNAAEKKMQAQLTDQTDVQMRLEAEALAAIKAPSPTTNKKDVLSKYLREGLKKDSVVQVQTLRTWLHEKA